MIKVGIIGASGIAQVAHIPGYQKNEEVKIIGEGESKLGISSESILGVGVGSPGPLNVTKGIIYFGPNLLGWTNVPIVDILREKLHLPVFLENDGNSAALGEWWKGAGKDVDSLALFTLGTGIGGGIIINGKVLHGAWDTAGELGHMMIHEGGLVCSCGRRGCLEAYASATGVVKRTLGALKEKKRVYLLSWWKIDWVISLAR